MSPSDEIVREWLQKAENDLRSAERLLAEPAALPDTASFHCQQAVEKSLKALLQSHQADIPRTHDLRALAGMCRELEPTLDSNLANRAAELNEYAVASRYVSWREITLDEAKSVYRLARELCREVQTLPALEKLRQTED